MKDLKNSLVYHEDGQEFDPKNIPLDDILNDPDLESKYIRTNIKTLKKQYSSDYIMVLLGKNKDKISVIQSNCIGALYDAAEEAGLSLSGHFARTLHLREEEEEF